MRTFQRKAEEAAAAFAKQMPETAGEFRVYEAADGDLAVADRLRKPSIP
ncbi:MULTISPECIES: hypothetical protein [Streptomyces]